MTALRLTDAERVLRAETEAEFLGWVLDVAKLAGFRVAHFRPAMTARGWRTPVQADGAGFPDLILARGNRVIAVELKRQTGNPTAEQRLWLDALEDGGVECFVWRPGDRAHIQAVLLGDRS